METDIENEMEWIDILGSGQLKKKVIKKGEPDSRPERFDVCTINYTARLEDATVIEEVDQLKINLGEAEVIQGLDFSLPLMDTGEECELIVAPRFAYGKLGLPPNVLPDTKLHYSVTLLRSEPPPELNSLTYLQRKNIGNHKRERGNWWYNREEHCLAIQCYRRAVEYLDDTECAVQLQKEEMQDLLEERIKVFNNLAVAQMKIQAYDSALQSVDNVLQVKPKNVKALFRKGKIIAEKGDINGGISLLLQALALDPTNKLAKSELDKLRIVQRVHAEEEKQLYKKMLGASGDKQDNQDEKNSSIFQRLPWAMMLGLGTMAVAAFCKYKYF